MLYVCLYSWIFLESQSGGEGQSASSVPPVPQRNDLAPVKVRAGLAAELLELLRIK